ncbi:MAG TPA: hypothetical protein VLL05_02080, partial [Terriglobales bacterium]|nr:hypothetical protein [Terriglobales bacterium]
PEPAIAVPGTGRVCLHGGVAVSDQATDWRSYDSVAEPYARVRAIHHTLLARDLVALVAPAFRSRALSRKGHWLALAAALTGRMMSRPALVTVHGALRPDYPCYKRGSLSKSLHILFGTAREVACESEAVRDAIIRGGIRREKVRVLAALSSNDAGHMADWLTGELLPEEKAKITTPA